MRLVVALLLSVAVASCGGARKDAADSTGTRADSSGGGIAPKPKPYSVAPGESGTLVSGVVDTSGGAARTAAKDCAAPAAEPGESPPVVWIDGVQRGKPMPIERRYFLVSSGCSLDPRVQPVVVGGTINVFNDDRVLHRLVFIHSASGDTLQTMPFTNGGQVVASERLTKSPGVVEVRCAQHPEERAYIVVFDHPYFTVAEGGEYAIDSVPPGDRQVMAWREGRGSWILSK